MNLLVLNDDSKDKIQKLIELAQDHPINIQVVSEKLKTPSGRAEHMTQMRAQTIEIPVDHVATFSIETDHPIGTCRHLSVSIGDGSKAPSVPSVWILATQFGFWGTLEDTHGWVEDFNHRGRAINLVQTMLPTPAQTH